MGVFDCAKNQQNCDNPGVWLRIWKNEDSFTEQGRIFYKPCLMDVLLDHWSILKGQKGIQEPDLCGLLVIDSQTPECKTGDPDTVNDL
jgi:hypothetical protein